MNKSTLIVSEKSNASSATRLQESCDWRMPRLSAWNACTKSTGPNHIEDTELAAANARSRALRPQRGQPKPDERSSLEAELNEMESRSTHLRRLIERQPTAPEEVMSDRRGWLHDAETRAADLRRLLGL